MAISLHRWFAFYKYLTETLCGCFEMKRIVQQWVVAKLPQRLKKSMVLQNTFEMLISKKRFILFFLSFEAIFALFFRISAHCDLSCSKVQNTFRDYKLSYFLPFSFDRVQFPL